MQVRNITMKCTGEKGKKESFTIGLSSSERFPTGCLKSSLESPPPIESSNNVQSFIEKRKYNCNEKAFKNMELLISRALEEGSGISMRAVQNFFSKIPSVFTGHDLIIWLFENTDVDDAAEAQHLAQMMVVYGYVFPVEDHFVVKNDNSFYRFQTPFFWISSYPEPDNTEYAVYLSKRIMQNKQRLELQDYEAENLAKLQKSLSRKWEFIFLQAEAQAKVDRKRDKMERLVLDSQERAFWNIHRPHPCMQNITEVDMRKILRGKYRHCENLPSGVDSEESEESIEILKKKVEELTRRIAQPTVKMSKSVESIKIYYEQYSEFDPLITSPDPPNPWVSDCTEFWEQGSSVKDIPPARVKKWALSIMELLKDSAGIESLGEFLEKEYSAENLKFLLACRELRGLSRSQVKDRVAEIYKTFLAPESPDPINVDGRVSEDVKKKVKNLELSDKVPDRHIFEEAEKHIFKLMKSDSYNRFIRSDQYKEMLIGCRKKHWKVVRVTMSMSRRRSPAEKRLIALPSQSKAH